MAPRVTTATLVLKPMPARQESALDQIPSPAQRATNVTMRAHAIRKPEHVRIHRNKTALRVATVTLVRKPIHASQEYVLDQIRLPARRATSVMTREHAMLKPAFVQIRRKQTALVVTITTPAPKPILASPGHVLDQIPSRAPRVTNVTTRAHAIHKLVCVR